MGISKLFSVLILLSVCWAQSSAADSSPCGTDWEPFRDEHCYKIADKTNLHTFEDAQKSCTQAGDTLINIRSKDEQDFLVNQFFVKNKIVDNIWIGAKFEDNQKQFKWVSDNSNLAYSNWIPGHPKNLTGFCVEMETGVDSAGKWVDEPCQKKNLVICQKKQIVTLSGVLNLVHELKQEVQQLRESQLPIGLIYTQLPGEKSPVEIWPSMKWTDISANYSGVFFRVLGNGSATFGQIQDGSAPRFTGVDRNEDFVMNKNVYKTQIETRKDNWSEYVRSTSPHNITGEKYDVMRFHVSGGEVRPKNMAVKVWRRSS